MEIRVEAWGVERERGRRRSPGTKNKGWPPLSLAVARGAIRPAFQLTGRRCSRVRPRRKLGLFTRRLRDVAVRGERKLATINSKNQFGRRWFFGGRGAATGGAAGDKPRGPRSSLFFFPPIAAAPFSQNRRIPIRRCSLSSGQYLRSTPGVADPPQ